MNNPLQQTDRTRLRRKRDRGHFDRATINAILDAMPMCHIGYQQSGVPVVMPNIQWRDDDHVYWHASSGGRGVKSWREGPVCVTVSLLDGLVLARTGLNHSCNYRSVMLFGQPQEITDYDAKVEKLNHLIDALYPGRSNELRPMSDSDIKQTALFALPIEEGSAKVRNTGVIDEEDDYSQPVWCGVIPVETRLRKAEADPRNLQGIEQPAYLEQLSIG